MTVVVMVCNDCTMTTTRTITRTEAENLLRLTSRTNQSALIGTPNQGFYTLHEALGSLGRCDGVLQVESLNGFHVLKGSDPANGQHRWFVSAASATADINGWPVARDPWA